MTRRKKDSIQTQRIPVSKGTLIGQKAKTRIIKQKMMISNQKMMVINQKVIVPNRSRQAVHGRI